MEDLIVDMVYESGTVSRNPTPALTSNESSVRLHDLAIQAWCNRAFVIQSGYPVPVVFGSPMDATANFSELWKRSENPFTYLLDLKDSAGRPLYQPYPANICYPLISIQKRRWTFNPNRNYSTHRFRKLANLSNDSTQANDDRGTWKQRNMPMGIDFHYQVDYFSMRPDSQAVMVGQIFSQFWRQGGGPRTWVPVPYNPEFGSRYVHMELNGDVQNMTKDEPGNDSHVEYRLTFNLVLQGWMTDAGYEIVPSMMALLGNSDLWTPATLAVITKVDGFVVR